MRKFLYGRKEFLMPILEGVRSPRFSEIAHYARLENKAMRDDETVKKFILSRSKIRLEINGVHIPSHHIADDIEINMPVRRCFCLCLSAKSNDPELFKGFNADTCLTIDVGILLDRLNSVLSYKLPGAYAIGKRVTYYDPYCFTPSLGPDDLVFCKPHSFAHEDEFRVAIFFPPEKYAVKSIDGGAIPLIDADNPKHVMFTHTDKGFIGDFVVDHFFVAH